jgi:hypothetical protein
VTLSALPHCTAFRGTERIAAGDVAAVALAVRRRRDAGDTEPILVFDDASGAPVDLDLRGTDAEIRSRLETRFAAPVAEPAAPRRPGRPKLGVVAREVTLLPRHWDWLARQPGGASVALRKLVEAARRADDGDARRAQEAAYRFMTATAGDEPGFEAAIRALFAGDRAGFDAHVAAWPPDIRDHARRLASPAFAPDIACHKT